MQLPASVSGTGSKEKVNRSLETLWRGGYGRGSATGIVVRRWLQCVNLREGGKSRAVGRFYIAEEFRLQAICKRRPRRGLYHRRRRAQPPYSSVLLPNARSSCCRPRPCSQAGGTQAQEWCAYNSPSSDWWMVGTHSCVTVARNPALLSLVAKR